MHYDANGSKRTREVRGGRSSKRHRQRRCPPFRCNIYPRSKRGTTAELGLATRHSALDGFRVSFRTTRSNYGVWEGNFSRLNFQRTRLYSFIRVLKFPRSRGTDSRAAAERTRTKIAGRWRIVRGASPRQRASAKKSRFFLFFLPLANDPSLFLSLLSDSFLDRPHLRRLIRARRWISIEHANDWEASGKYRYPPHVHVQLKSVDRPLSVESGSLINGEKKKKKKIGWRDTRHPECFVTFDCVSRNASSANGGGDSLSRKLLINSIDEGKEAFH